MIGGIGNQAQILWSKCSALSITWMIIKKKKKTNIIQINLPSTFEDHDFSFWISGPWWSKFSQLWKQEGPVVII